MLDDDIGLANELEQDRQRNPVYYFLPNPGGQAEAWLSTHPVTHVLGGNASGKSQLLMAIATAMSLPHPQDQNYSYYPGPDDLNLLDGADTKTIEFKKRCLELRMQGYKFKLPTSIWISKNSFPDHKEVTMRYLSRGYETDRVIVPPLLAEHVVAADFQESGVWGTVTLDCQSRVTLKAVRAGVSSYQGRAVTAVILDEPHPQNIYNECKMRLRETGGKGRLYYGMTGVPDTEDPSIWRRIVWFRDNMLVLGDTDIQRTIYIHAKENKHIDYEAMLNLMEGMSDEEKETRLSGRIALLSGKPYFDVHILQRLHKVALYANPLHIGTMQFSTVPDDFGNLSIYIDDNEYADFIVTIYEFPSLTKNYYVGVDVGGGYDKTAVVVLSDEGKIVAVGHGHIDEVSLAHELYKLGKFYKGRHRFGAKIAIEVNSVGKGTQALMLAGEEGVYRYTNLFRRVPSAYERKGRVRLAGSDIGWITTGSNKMAMAVDARAFTTRAVKALPNQILIPHKELLNEMSTFCYNDKGGSSMSIEAWEGSHDDLVMAWMIAIQCMKTISGGIIDIEYPGGRRPMLRRPEPVYIWKDGGVAINFGEVERRIAESGYSIGTP